MESKQNTKISNENLRQQYWPQTPAGTIALIGDLRQMSSEWLRAVSYTGYGVSLSVAVGIPIPIIDEDMLSSVCVTDAQLKAPVVDYSEFYPFGQGEAKVGEVTYKELKSGSIHIKNQEVPTGSFSSYRLARKVAHHLKQLIQDGGFLLTQFQAPLPGAAVGKEATE